MSNADGRKTEWSWARANPEKHKNLVNRLGNILIIEAEINDDVGNHEFRVKQDGQFKKKSGKIKSYKCFQNSALKWPSRIGDQTKWKKWTEAEINERQAEMAKDALKVWSV